jgi:hypothetical protein
MADASATRRRYARLHFADGEVIVTPKDRDIFLISATRAAEACREAVRVDQRVRQFESEFLVPLHSWCKARAGKIRACYLPLPVGHLQVFAVTNSPTYDFALGEEMAALEGELARAGWRVGVSQLPATDPATQETFFSPEGALEVYAERGPAPAEGGE